MCACKCLLVLEQGLLTSPKHLSCVVRSAAGKSQELCEELLGVKVIKAFIASDAIQGAGEPFRRALVQYAGAFGVAMFLRSGTEYKLEHGSSP
jgi:hypothetical protein